MIPLLGHRLKTGNRTQFIELLFYIYFEIWSFIHTKVKIYTYKKMGRLHTGIIIHYLYFIFFSIMYSSSCTGSPGRIKVYKTPNLQCIKVPSSMYKRPDCTNYQFLVYRSSSKK